MLLAEVVEGEVVEGAGAEVVEGAGTEVVEGIRAVVEMEGLLGLGGGVPGPLEATSATRYQFTTPVTAIALNLKFPTPLVGAVHVKVIDFEGLNPVRCPIVD